MAAEPRDFYEVLGVARTASADDIRNAYRALAKKYHPDINKQTGAEDSFKEINEAYGVLSDDQRRAAYDRFGHAGLNGMPQGFGSDFGGLGDIFEEFFRGFGMSTGAARRSPRRGPDLRVEITLPFAEAAGGVEKSIEVTRHESCPACHGSGAEPGSSPVRCATCHGSGEVRQVRETFLGSMVNVGTCPACNGAGETIPTACKSCRGRGLERRSRTLAVPIPAGVDEGTQIRLAGEGEPGLFGGPHGNLYVLIHVEPHAFFRRHRDDLVVEVGINLAQAALGAEISIPSLDGDIRTTLPAGVQTGHVVRLKGKGIPHVQRNGRGDLLAIINVQVPTRLTAEQKRLLRELGQALDSKPQPLSESLYERLKGHLGE
jgi:molecular chaperone DnaJ